MTHEELLEQSPVFKGLPGELRALVAAVGVEQRYSPGQRVFQEGDDSTHFYVIEEGRVALEMNVHVGRAEGSGRRAFAAVIGPTESFGWSALVPPHTRTMSALAIQPTSVLAIDGQALQRLVADDAAAGAIIFGQLSELISSRLEEARAKLCFIISLVSHELKAPLAAVESYLQVMLGGYAGEMSEKQRAMVGRCSHRVQELIELINSLLRVSRIETGDLSQEIKPAALATIVGEAMENVGPAAAIKGIALRDRIPDGLPLLPLAPLRIQETITNLLDNAVKFTPSAGTVEILASDHPDFVEVEVVDTGMGIPLEEQPRIFDEFYRGEKADAKGLGLGLALVKKIVEAHGGRIWVESPPSGRTVGTAFHFTLWKSGSGRAPGSKNSKPGRVEAA